MTTQLQPVGAELRVRLEGAVESLERAFADIDARRLDAVAQDWGRTAEALEAARKHPELSSFVQTFDAALGSLDAWSRSECEALGLRMPETLPARLQAVSKASRPAKAERVMGSGGARGVALGGMLTAAVLLGAWQWLSAERLVFIAPLLFVATWGVLQAWSGWAITTGHVNARWPRRTSIPIADITHLVPRPGALVLQTQTQRLTLHTSRPEDELLVIRLLQRGVLPSRGETFVTRSRAGRTVVLDATGLAVVDLPSTVAAKFDPRALAEATEGDFFALHRLHLSAATVTFGTDEVRFTDAHGDLERFVRGLISARS